MREGEIIYNRFLKFTESNRNLRYTLNIKSWSGSFNNYINKTDKEWIICGVLLRFGVTEEEICDMTYGEMLTYYYLFINS